MGSSVSLLFFFSSKAVGYVISDYDYLRLGSAFVLNRIPHKKMAENTGAMQSMNWVKAMQISPSTLPVGLLEWCPSVCLSVHPQLHIMLLLLSEQTFSCDPETYTIHSTLSRGGQSRPLVAPHTQPSSPTIDGSISDSVLEWLPAVLPHSA